MKTKSSTAKPSRTTAQSPARVDVPLSTELVTVLMKAIITPPRHACNSVIHYMLTKNGRSLVAFALNKRKIPKRLRLKTNEIFSDYGSESIIDLVKRVYDEYPEWTEKSVFFSP